MLLLEYMRVDRKVSVVDPFASADATGSTVLPLKAEAPGLAATGAATVASASAAHCMHRVYLPVQPHENRSRDSRCCSQLSQVKGSGSSRRSRSSRYGCLSNLSVAGGKLGAGGMLLATVGSGAWEATMVQRPTVAGFVHRCALTLLQGAKARNQRSHQLRSSRPVLALML